MKPEESADAPDRPLPLTIDWLDTPALLVDLPRLYRNLAQMAEICGQRGTVLRPHAKSHKSRGLMQLQLESGAAGITVSKLDEAVALSTAGGCRDVFLAYPIASELKAARAMKLARDVNLTLSVDTIAGAGIINQAATEAGVAVRVLIEIDCGLARCGIKPEDAEDVAGVFTHAGHAYAASSREELRSIAEQEVKEVVQAASGAARGGAEVRVISVGSTPTVLTNVDALEKVSELRPGNYLFKDRMQIALGVAAVDECALSVLTTVVSTSTGHAVIDAGSKTLGLDKGAHGNDALVGYGLDPESGWIVNRLSEEHGVISDGASRYRVGDVLRLIPNHACVVTDRAAVLYAVADHEIVHRFGVDVRGGGR
jgi:D-serine deaminase-like pyridoxal phosphate-dependent protein